MQWAARQELGRWLDGGVRDGTGGRPCRDGDARLDRAALRASGQRRAPRASRRAARGQGLRWGDRYLRDRGQPGGPGVHAGRSRGDRCHGAVEGSPERRARRRYRGSGRVSPQARRSTRAGVSPRSRVAPDQRSDEPQLRVRFARIGGGDPVYQPACRQRVQGNRRSPGRRHHRFAFDVARLARGVTSFQRYVQGEVFIAGRDCKSTRRAIRRIGNLRRLGIERDRFRRIGRRIGRPHSLVRPHGREVARAAGAGMPAHARAR